MKKIYTLSLLILFCIILSVPVLADEASDAPSSADNSVLSKQASITVKSNGKNCKGLLDDSYSTVVKFNSGDEITVESDEALRGIYIKWHGEVNPWTLSYNGKTKYCGENGFVHEYVDLEEDTTSLTITLSESISISDISAYTRGTLPEDVQVWKKPCKTADFLVFAAHADDDILFLGGVLATYGGKGCSVQVAYMCDFWNKEPVREHEKIDGLWEIGIRNYPVCGGFADIKSLSLERAKEIYSYDEVKEFVTDNIRRFKPLICVTQDLNGEYGHGAHMILANAVCESVDNSSDPAYFPESADKYGTFDVKKTYLHLYPDNKIRLDLHIPIETLGKRTALEAASDAYLKHVSQQVWDFVVSDNYEHSCAEFGLYRTTVGTDTGNDMLENIITYEAQQKLEEEKQASIAASITASKEAESLAQYTTSNKTSALSKKTDSMPVIIIILLLFLAIILTIICAVKYIRSKNKRLSRKYAQNKKKHNRRN